MGAALAGVGGSSGPSGDRSCALVRPPRRLFAIGSQLSPEQGSSGIEMLETDTFKLHCFQTLTGRAPLAGWLAGRPRSWALSGRLQTNPGS